MKIRCEGISALIIAGVLYSGCLLPAEAQNVTCATRPTGDNSNACASTAFVQNTVGGSFISATAPLTASFGSGTWTLGLNISSSLAVSGGNLTLASIGSNTILGNATAGAAVPTALAIPSCSGANQALTWTTNTGFGCATISVTPANPTASIGLTAVNGAASTYMRSDAAPALSQAIAPTWTGKHIWSGSSSGLQTSGAPPITVTENWFGVGVQAQTWVDSVFVTTDATKPSLARHTTIDHNVGFGSPYTIFGMVDFFAIVGRSTGGNIYGINGVCMADTSFNKLLQCMELDINNYSGAHAGGVGTSSGQYGTTYAGSGPHRITAGIYMTGAGNAGNFLSTYGLVFDDKAVSAYNIYDDDSSSNTLYAAIGAHQYGLLWHGATFSTAWATVPNNTPLQYLNAAGTVLRNVLNMDNTDKIAIGDGSHTINIAGSLEILGQAFNYTSPTTWTPVVSCSGGGTPTYSVQVGYYTMTGRNVQAWFYVTTSNLGGCAGNVTLTGLPITSTATANDRGYVGITNFQGINGGAGQTMVSGFVGTSSTVITLVVASATGTAPAVITAAMLTNPVTFQGLATYHN